MGIILNDFPNPLKCDIDQTLNIKGFEINMHLIMLKFVQFLCKNFHACWVSFDCKFQAKVKNINLRDL